MNQRLSTVDAHVRSFRTFRPFQSTHLDCGHVKIELVPLTGVSHNQFLVYPPLLRIMLETRSTLIYPEREGKI